MDSTAGQKNGEGGLTRKGIPSQIPTRETLDGVGYGRPKGLRSVSPEGTW